MVGWSVLPPTFLLKVRKVTQFQPTLLRIIFDYGVVNSLLALIGDLFCNSKIVGWFALPPTYLQKVRKVIIFSAY